MPRSPLGVPSTSTKQAEQLGLESWPRSPSPVGPRAFPCMPVTSHLAISYSVIRCLFNSWINRGVLRRSSYTCHCAFLHLVSIVSLPFISTFLASTLCTVVFSIPGALAFVDSFTPIILSG